MLGRGDAVASRRVHYHDAALGRCRGIHVVQTGPCPADHPQLVGGGDHLGRHLGRAADDQAIVVLDLAEQLLLRRLGLDVDGQTGLLKNLDPLLGEDVADQDFHLASSSSSAFPTPTPSFTGWPSPFSTISVAAIAWMTSKVSTYPMCEIRKIFPLRWSCPPAAVIPYCSRRFLYTACPSTPDGADTTVSASLGLCLGKSERPAAFMPSLFARHARLAHAMREGMKA